MPAAELHWKTFSSIADFRNCFSDAGLLSDVGRHDLFSSLDWLGLLESSVFETGATSIICTASSAQGLKALLPLQVRRRQGVFSVQGLHSLSNYYSPLFSIQLAAGLPGQTALHFVCSQLSQVRPGWHWLDLEPLSQEVRDQLSSSLAINGFAVFPYFRFGNWYLRLEGRCFTDYARDRPARLQNTIVRKRKRLGKQGAWEIRMFRGESQLQAGIDAYWQVYNASWKQREPYTEFINGLVRLAAQRDWLRLGVLYLDGHPIAVQLWLVYRGTASIYKLAYDERFKAFSPGSILSEHMFEQVIDGDRVEEIDYLVGDEAYKRDWMSGRRERWGLLAFNLSTLAGRGLAASERFKRALKSVRAETS